MPNLSATSSGSDVRIATPQSPAHGLEVMSLTQLGLLHCLWVTRAMSINSVLLVASIASDCAGRFEIGLGLGPIWPYTHFTHVSRRSQFELWG
jgi:hypothetical protein